MIFLITEETAIYRIGITTRTPAIEYYECGSKDEVKEFYKKQDPRT